MESDRYQEHGNHWTMRKLSPYMSAKAFKEFNAVFQARKARQALVPTTFVDPIRPKDVRQKKGRRRGLTLREALEEEEADK